MNYNLNNLGTQNFEHLVQALSKKIIGEGVSIFGAGPDGQREASFHGIAPYPSKENYWDGYWVIQAKFKEANTKTADYNWLKSNFEKEMQGFESKKKEGISIPNNYLFFTNIVLTPPLKNGLKDKMDKLAEKYKELIPNIHIIGADDINRFLDGHRDIAVTYASYILSGDIISYIYQEFQHKEKEQQNAFFRYLLQAFSDDSCSRMEQAGQVTDDKVSIDKVYVDLNFQYEESENQGKFIEHSIKTGNNFFRLSSIEEKNENKSTKNPSQNKYVLKGTAGQGKSTVCQFLAQIYRATFLDNFNNKKNPSIHDFLIRIKKDGINLPTCYRVPIRIELRLYSAWVINRQKEKKSYDLVTYISSIITDKAAQSFDNETLRIYLSKYSWAFFFDGLDEVPESSNRKVLMDEIDKFIEIELRQADTDAIFFATTRPEGYVGEFNKSNFTHINLVPLDKDTCFNYLRKLINAIENDSTKRSNYMQLLKQGLENEQIAFMMQTPLQATIIAILVKSGGEPPRDKYSLFKEYFDIILKREKQKGTGTILNSNQDLVESVYYLLGYNLQKRSSTTENSDALIPLNQVKELIKEKLKEDGIEETAEDYPHLLEEIHFMVVQRINFATELKEGYIGFSIRSMQEFLAAVHLVKTSDDRKLQTVAKDLAKSSYWKNTFIFLVECISKIKVYFLDTLIDTVLGELNGNDLPLGEFSETKCVYYGSQVAVTLLANNIFKNKPKYENKLCKYIQDYCTLKSCTDMHKIPEMSSNVKAELTNYLIYKEKPTVSDFLLTSFLLQTNTDRKLISFSKKYAIEIASQFYSSTNGKCPSALYEIVLSALEKGALLDLSLTQIDDIITNIDCTQKPTVNETLFKLSIKNILDKPMFSELKSGEIANYFKCDFKILIDIRKHMYNEYKITDYFSIRDGIPTITQDKLTDIIKLANTYSLPGLSLILDTIVSRDIKKYISFYQNIDKYYDEIILFNEEVLIKQNTLLFGIWKKLPNEDQFDINMFLNKYTIEHLSNLSKIESIKDLLDICEKDISLYSFSVTMSNVSFIDFFNKSNKNAQMMK